MNVENLLDLYTDYLLVTPSYSTATGLSSVTGNKVNHDRISPLLSKQITDKTLWQQVKPLVHEVSDESALLIIDGFHRTQAIHQTK